MVCCQEPPPLKGRKHSCHPHDAALVNALSFVSIGVEARSCPCHSAAHCWHMKRQPCLYHRRPCHGCRNCNRHRHLRRCRQLHCHCRCRCLLPSPSAIAVAVAVNHPRCCLCCVAVSHCHHHQRCPCHRSLPSPSPSALQLPSPLAITVTVSIGHFRELLPWRGENCIQPI